MKRFFQVLWFLAPLLILFGCVMAFLYVLLEARIGRFGR